MTSVLSFTTMLNDKEWIKSFFKQLIKHPIIIDYQQHKGDKIPEEIKLKLGLYDFKEFGYSCIKLRIIDVRKNITSRQFISLIDETYKFKHFIILRGKKITKCDELHVRLVLILNFLYKCYNQQSNNIFDTLVQRVITDEDFINDHPLFTFEELYEFYQFNLKTDIENFLSQANSYNVLIKMYCQNEFIKMIGNNPVFNNYELDRYILLLASSFIQFSSKLHSNEENLSKGELSPVNKKMEMWEQAKKYPTVMIKDFVRKLLIYRDDHTKLSPTKIMNRFPTKYGSGSKSTILRWFDEPVVRNTIENFYRKAKLKPSQAMMILQLEDLDELFNSLPVFTKYSKID